MNDRRNIGLAIAVRAIVCIAVIAAGVSVMVMLKTSITIEPPIADSAAPQRVVVVKAEQVEIRRQWRGYGTAQALDSADVPARVTTTVEKIDPTLQIGKVIHPTDKLVTLDDSDFVKQETTAHQRLAELNAHLTLLKIEESKIDKRRALAQEDEKLSRAEYAKIERFFKRDAAQKRELDVARRAVIIAERLGIEIDEAEEKIAVRRLQINAQVAAQTAQLELAQLNKQRCVIHSPIAGVVEAVDVDKGESMTPGQRVVRVVSLQRIEVALQLPAAARGDISVGSKVVLETANQSKLAWSSTVIRVSPVDDTSTRTFTVYVEVSQPNALTDFVAANGHGLLVPGMFVKGRASSQRSQARWVVPRRAIRNGRILVVSDDGKIESQQVEIDFVREGKLPQFGVIDDQWAVLEAVLAAGQLILVNGSTTVRDGQRVEPIFTSQQADQEAAQLPVTSTHRTHQKPEARQ